MAAHQPHNRRNTTTPSTKTRHAPSPTPPPSPPTQAPTPPTFDEEAFTLRINNQVDLQISKLQDTLAAQLEGPFVDTITHVVNDELLSNTAYTIALKAHFATFDHAKFALIPATWKPSLESKIDQTNARLDIATEQLARTDQHSHSSPAHHTDSPHDPPGTKQGPKPHDRSISSLQAEVQSQEITVNILSSSLELALEKIAKLEHELSNPPTIQFDKNLDYKISELSSLIDEKLKPLVLQQAFTKELNYVNGMTSNMNNKIFTDHCTSTGQGLPNLGAYAVDVPTYKLVRDIINASGPTTDHGHSGGRNDGATQSAPPVWTIQPPNKSK
jgi:hypothetical protein